MEENTARIGSGDVEIELDGQTYYLKPSLRAIQVISRQKNGIVGAIEAAGRYDFETILQVVTLGLGVNNKEARDLPERIYKAGMTRVAGPVIEYLTVLSNGGRPVDEFQADDDEGNRTGA